MALPGKKGTHGLAAGGPAGDRGGAGEAVDHRPADPPVPPLRSGVRMRGACRLPSWHGHYGTLIEAACRIVILEDQLEEALRLNAEYCRAAESVNPTAAA
ncbi:hypothetical protein [Streptomyces sp. RTd22]|uniref:hypothetical protein n=1 Tax=Streptomyces sp. RTd22 TaxID=1841249 RepID=UPI001F165A2E|nr:hypothetical protein [Streptomyces sp. RTd22]